MREFHKIVEFSFNEKKHAYIIRFLDGSCLRSQIDNFPANLQLKSALWEEAELGRDGDSLIVPTSGKKKLKIPAFTLYAAGQLL